MKVLVLGKNGQVACSLRQRLPDAQYLGRAELDLEQVEQIRPRIMEARPDFIVNAAAFTAVDLAEDEVERAWQVNAHAVREVAEGACALGVPVLHLSTDYVFSGKGERPYLESDPVEPVNQYGASKLAGEQALAESAGESYWILRTSWVFSEFGGNFVKTMLKLAQTRDHLSVVHDQRGRPSYAGDLADVICLIIARHRAGDSLPAGLYHCASAGVVSWYEFAAAVFEDAVARGLVAAQPMLTPIPSQDYPTRAERPMNSVLDTRRLEQALSWQPPDWRRGLRAMLDERTKGDG